MPNASHRVCRKNCTLQTTGCVQKKVHTADHRVCAEKSAHCRPEGVQKKVHTANHRVCRKKLHTAESRKKVRIKTNEEKAGNLKNYKEKNKHLISF